jgi:hypothetical protein
MRRVAWNKNHVKRECECCGQIMSVPMWKINQGKGKYCSRGCAQQPSIKIVICKNCKKEFAIRMTDYKRGRGKFCSHKCAQAYMVGARHGSWNGGKKINAYGYIMVWAKRSDRKYQYVHKHRLVMEKHLGRKLKKCEVVHHINGIKTDNRLCNLMLFKSQKAHVKFEAAARLK